MYLHPHDIVLTTDVTSKQSYVSEKKGFDVNIKLYPPF